MRQYACLRGCCKMEPVCESGGIRMYEKEIELLQNIIDDSGNIVFFGGAGVSTESNIPDFRLSLIHI